MIHNICCSFFSQTVFLLCPDFTKALLNRKQRSVSSTSNVSPAASRQSPAAAAESTSSQSHAASAVVSRTAQLERVRAHVMEFLGDALRWLALQSVLVALPLTSLSAMGCCHNLLNWTSSSCSGCCLMKMVMPVTVLSKRIIDGRSRMGRGGLSRCPFNFRLFSCRRPAQPLQRSRSCWLHYF
jgi:hypothetical protein